MIRYNITYKELLTRIKEEAPTWLENAKKRTDEFRRLGKYQEKSNIWREVKKVYMELQENKCAFCERKLEDKKSGGALEFDIEHFRPKSSVKTWLTSEIKEKLKLSKKPPKSTDRSNGYYLLSYHPLNYTVACKPCNTYFKKNYFPIQGKRDIKKDDPRKLVEEKAYLIYPIGDFDHDPETIIKFHGILAVPTVTAEENSEAYDRAKVTIEFFKLNRRCLEERMQRIIALYCAMRMLSNSPKVSDQDIARKSIHRLTLAKSPHANCIRSFKRLYESDREKAVQLIENIDAVISSGS